MPRCLCLLVLLVCSLSPLLADDMREFEARFRKLDQSDTKAVLELATWCTTKGLWKEAHFLAREVLDRNPRHEHAAGILRDARRVLAGAGDLDIPSERPAGAEPDLTRPRKPGDFERKEEVQGYVERLFSWGGHHWSSGDKDKARRTWGIILEHYPEAHYVETIKKVLAGGGEPGEPGDEPPGEKLRDAMGRDYWLYLPEKLDPAATYQLVVGVHGYGGTGQHAGGLADWPRRLRHVIVVGPSFPNQGYQFLEQKSDQQLIDLFAALKKRFKLHPRLFVAGFSGGAQYSHRFAIRHPELVAGCAAHSGGSWAIGRKARMWDREVDLMSLSDGARHLPMVISCGEADPRIRQTKLFEGMALAKGYSLVARYWPKVGHDESPGARRLTHECFELARREAAAAEAGFAAVRAALADKDLDKARAALARVEAIELPPTPIGKRYGEQLARRVAAQRAAIGK